VTVFTVGHSNHPIEHFLDLLRRAGIRMLVDVRSSPVSGYCPHFDKQPLQRALRVARVQYLFLGAELGGRPPETEFYDAAGYVLYDKMARSARFRAGVQRRVAWPLSSGPNCERDHTRQAQSDLHKTLPAAMLEFQFQLTLVVVSAKAQSQGQTCRTANSSRAAGTTSPATLMS
jgi:hypothetical protein